MLLGLSETLIVNGIYKLIVILAFTVTFCEVAGKMCVAKFFFHVQISQTFYSTWYFLLNIKLNLYKKS